MLLPGEKCYILPRIHTLTYGVHSGMQSTPNVEYPPLMHLGLPTISPSLKDIYVVNYVVPDCAQHMKQKKNILRCANRESNPGQMLGRHLCYHYTIGAKVNPNFILTDLMALAIGPTGLKSYLQLRCPVSVSWIQCFNWHGWAGLDTSTFIVAIQCVRTKTAVQQWAAHDHGREVKASSTV